MDFANRAIYRGQVTKIVNNVSEYLQSQDAQVNAQNLAKFDEIEENLTVLLERLTAARENLNKANDKIRTSLKSEDYEIECQAMADYDDKAVAAIARLNQRLKKLQQIQQRSEPSSSNCLKSNERSKDSIKLPRIGLRKFSGKIEEWLPFWEQFRTMVHGNRDLNASEKFNYLESVLTGKAADSIAGYTPTEGCYDAAIASLLEEYGDTEKIIDKTMQVLMSLRTVTSRHDTSALRQLYNTVTASTRSLTALGVPSYNYSVMLKSVLLKCMPKELVIDFHRSHTNSDQGNGENNSMKDDDSKSAVTSDSPIDNKGDRRLENILQFLKREVESLERTNASGLMKLPKNEKTNGNKFSHSTVAGLLSPSEIKGCCFCNSVNHLSANCDSKISIPRRKEILKQQGRCFRCTRLGHNSRTCRVYVRCSKCDCKHATAICDPKFEGKLSLPAKLLDKEKNVQPSTMLTTNLYSGAEYDSPTVFLQTACAVISSMKRSPSLLVRVVFDGGSQRTYVRESVANELNLEPVDTVKISILPFGSAKKGEPKKFQRVKVMLKGQFNDKCTTILAIVVPEICMDVLPVPNGNSGVFKKFILADNPVISAPISGISVLVGADNYWRVVLQESERLTPQLTAINTILGWTIQGGVSDINDVENAKVTAMSTTLQVSSLIDNDVDQDLDENSKRFWDLETLGITSVDGDNCIKYEIDSHIKRGKERYEASLLWKNVNNSLDSYRNGALVRFNNLFRKLSREPSKLLDYDRAMWDYIDGGVAERVIPSKEIGLNQSMHSTYYMPHRPVYREDKETTKLRIVFDASARSSMNLSLNDHLSAGPNLLPDILTVLLNFRLGLIGLVADIEKAFLQISLSERDRDTHRFFWFANKLDGLDSSPECVEYRMTRVTFGVTCSPYLLCATLRKHFEEETTSYPKTCELLKTSFYMDDLVTSVNDDGIAMDVYGETCEILKRASMRIRKWNSNSRKIRAVFSESGDCVDIQKVLGLLWYCQTDELAVDQQFAIPAATNVTKRIVLQLIARIFDPLGMVGPFVVKLKIIFQDIWRLKLDWDDELPKDLLTTWNKCMSQMPLLRDVNLLRCVFSSAERTNEQLHIFADASLHAYGAVAYIRSINADGKIIVRYLCSKNRLAPLKLNGSKDLTLPKLELTAALIAARLSSYIRDNLKANFNSLYLWSDSKIALYWIKGSNQKVQPYVVHRVREIQSLTDKGQWRHCPGAENPADLLTRGIFIQQLLKSPEWFNGPRWLSDLSDNWPEICTDFDNEKNILCLQVAESRPTDSPELLKVSDFSNYGRLLRITAYVLRFLNAFKIASSFNGYIRCTNEQETTLGGKRERKRLSAKHILNAEIFYIRIAQGETYHDEIQALRKGKPISSSSKILKLNPVLDEDNVLCLGSRLEYAEFEVSTAYPIILPKAADITTKIIEHAHERVLHGGVNAVLTKLREKFWVIKARQRVKTIISRCKICHRLRGKPASQPFAPLPRNRLTSSRPFETTGVDFAGPLFVKNATDGDKLSKVYILLLTCATTRAVHLELVPNLTSDSCLLALRRFISRRGAPNTFISDNAKTFKRAALELRQLGDVIESDALQNYIANRRIGWNFIVERAAWWGGFYERLVKSVKDILKATIRRATLTFEQLETFLTEAESTINARPLTYISDDPLDLSLLTPAHFLTGCLPPLNG